MECFASVADSMVCSYVKDRISIELSIFALTITDRRLRKVTIVPTELPVPRPQPVQSHLQLTKENNYEYEFMF